MARRRCLGMSLQQTFFRPDARCSLERSRRAPNVVPNRQTRRRCRRAPIRASSNGSARHTRPPLRGALSTRVGTIRISGSSRSDGNNVKTLSGLPPHSNLLRDPSTAQHVVVEEDSSATPGSPRIFCMIYTHAKNHPKAKASAETWMPRCDGAIVASDTDDQTLGAVRIPHEGPEEWKNVWQK